MLWLSQYNKKSQLPKNILIANAVAACEVSQDIMDQTIELATQMEKDGIIQPEAALIIRSSHAIRSVVFEKTHNNPNKLTEETIQDIISAFVENESSKEKKEAIQSAVDQASERLNSIHAKEIEEKDHQLEEEINKQRNTVIQMREDAEKSARKSAKQAASITKYVLAALWLIVVVLSVLCWVKGGLGHGIVGAVLGVLALLQIADYLFKFKSIPRRVSKNVEDKVFTRSYDRELKKREEISHISLRI